MRSRLALGLILVGFAVVAADAAADPAATAAAPENKPPSFKDDVSPILAANCASCHSGRKKKGGIDVSSYATLVRTVKAGDPDKSRLVKSLHGKGARQMPPRSKLDPKEIELIRSWVASGAKNN